MNTTPHISSHEANLDFVRALAVLLVVSSHLSWFFGDVHFGVLEPALFGKLGVIIFFVHSGIVNMLSIERHIQKHGRHRLFRAFMTRRCLRIYPLSIVVVSLVFVGHLPVSHIERYATVVGQHAGSEFIPSLLLVQNFLRFDQILGPLWSLPYEVQIYCLFPAIYLALRRFTSSKILVFTWALLAALDHFIAPHLAKHGNLGAFATIPDMVFYFLLFLAGIYAYKEMHDSRRLVPFWLLGSFLGSACVVWCFSYDQTKCIFITFCLGLALPYVQPCPMVGVNHLCKWLAKYSYGIYLLHVPAIWLAFVRCGHLPMVARICIFVLTTLGASVVAYHAIEHPMILIGNRAAAAISANKGPSKAKAAAALAGAAG